MKQVIISKYGAPNVLKVQEKRTPTPRKDQVLIRNYFSGINFSGDSPLFKSLSIWRAIEGL